MRAQPHTDAHTQYILANSVEEAEFEKGKQLPYNVTSPAPLPMQKWGVWSVESPTPTPTPISHPPPPLP